MKQQYKRLSVIIIERLQKKNENNKTVHTLS